MRAERKRRSRGSRGRRRHGAEIAVKIAVDDGFDAVAQVFDGFFRFFHATCFQRLGKVGIGSERIGGELVGCIVLIVAAGQKQCRYKNGGRQK